MPPAILTGCAALATLSLHGNPVTVEQLRETEGYAAFDERRRRKYDKQVGRLVWPVLKFVRSMAQPACSMHHHCQSHASSLTVKIFAH